MKKFFLFLIITIFFYSTVSIADNHFSVRLNIISLQSRLVGTNQLLFLGDSNVEQFYWNSLNGKLILNAGIGGAGIDATLLAAKTILPISKPNKVLVMVGVNDCINGSEYNPVEWGNKLINLIDIIYSYGAIPIIGSILPIEDNKLLPLGVNYFNNSCIRALNYQWWLIVTEYNIEHINLNYTFAVPPLYNRMHPNWTTDGVHLNRVGNVNLYYVLKDFL